jgi:prevent-host-death family protein
VPHRPKPVVRETVSLYQAKTDLSSLVERASAGEEFVITKSGKPKARLVPIQVERPLRVPGQGRGKWWVSPDFDAPMTDAELRDWGMGE